MIKKCIGCGITLQSENKESYKIPVAIKVEHTYDYPVYPNQDTDIPADSYMFDENGHCLGRSDGKPLNDADAAYLMREGVRKAIEAARRDDNPKFHRSAAEKELCFRFFYKYGAKSDQLCDVFQELAAKANTASTADEKLALLQQSADAFYKAREWHYHCSKGGMMWFQDMWECFYNSQNERFCWVDKILENIKEAQKEIAVIEPWILNQAQAGFLQTDIYRAFPDDNKTMLRNVITRLVNQGKIQKQKKGSSYFIQAIVPEEVDLV